MVGHDRKYWVAALPNLQNITILQYYNITILQYWEAAALPNHLMVVIQKRKCGHKCDKRKYIIWHVAASLKVSQQKEDEGSYLILRGLASVQGAPQIFGNWRQTAFTLRRPIA